MLAIFLVFGAIMGSIIKACYAMIGINVDDRIGGWLVGCAILIFLFVVYRNKLQFHGFYKSEGQTKLSKKVTYSLISCSILLLVVAPILS